MHAFPCVGSVKVVIWPSSAVISSPGYFSVLRNMSISSQGVRNVASICLQIGYPTIASVPHSIINGYKRVLAVAVETDYTFPLAEKVMAGFELYTGMLEMQPGTFTACPLV